MAKIQKTKKKRRRRKKKTQLKRKKKKKTTTTNKNVKKKQKKMMRRKNKRKTNQKSRRRMTIKNFINMPQIPTLHLVRNSKLNTLTLKTPHPPNPIVMKISTNHKITIQQKRRSIYLQKEVIPMENLDWRKSRRLNTLNHKYRW